MKKVTKEALFTILFLTLATLCCMFIVSQNGCTASLKAPATSAQPSIKAAQDSLDIAKTEADGTSLALNKADNAIPVGHKAKEPITLAKSHNDAAIKALDTASPALKEAAPLVAEHEKNELAAIKKVEDLQSNAPLQRALWIISGIFAAIATVAGVLVIYLPIGKVALVEIALAAAGISGAVLWASFHIPALEWAGMALVVAVLAYYLVKTGVLKSKATAKVDALLSAHASPNAGYPGSLILTDVSTWTHIAESKGHELVSALKKDAEKAGINVPK